ncbi:MAG: hypothetical protein K6L81_02045 [Agarilytica sp.]
MGTFTLELQTEIPVDLTNSSFLFLWERLESETGSSAGPLELGAYPGGIEDQGFDFGDGAEALFTIDIEKVLLDALTEDGHENHKYKRKDLEETAEAFERLAVMLREKALEAS